VPQSGTPVIDFGSASLLLAVLIIGDDEIGVTAGTYRADEDGADEENMKTACVRYSSQKIM
jgi:hypothetical protein